MRLRYTLKFKLIVSVLLIMSVTYGISSFVIYHNVFGTMEEQIIMDEQQKLEQTSHQLEYVQESVEGVAKQIVILPNSRISSKRAAQRTALRLWSAMTK